MMFKTARRYTLLYLIAVHASLALCGGGHHALDAVVRGGEAQASEVAKAVLLPAGDGCAVCDLLSLPFLPVELAVATPGDAVVASSVRHVGVLHHRPFQFLVAPPRAPPPYSA